MKFECPKCGAVPHKCGKGTCRAGVRCDGCICECYDDDERSARDDHGVSHANRCTTAVCTHCRWSGTIPVVPKKLQAWEKKALEAGWVPPVARKKELGI